MSVISTPTRRTNNNRRDETSEFDGIWLNIGVQMGGEDGADPVFVRMPRGVAVSDLQVRKVYSTMDPDFAAQVTLMNQVIELVQAKGLELEEGESVPIALEVQLYRRQEEEDVSPSKADNKALSATLFGS